MSLPLSIPLGFLVSELELEPGKELLPLNSHINSVIVVHSPIICCDRKYKHTNVNLEFYMYEPQWYSMEPNRSYQKWLDKVFSSYRKFTTIFKRELQQKKVDPAPWGGRKYKRETGNRWEGGTVELLGATCSVPNGSKNPLNTHTTICNTPKGYSRGKKAASTVLYIKKIFTLKTY